MYQDITVKGLLTIDLNILTKDIKALFLKLGEIKIVQ